MLECQSLSFPGFFLTKIFHPNVAQNGAICVNTLKRDWKPEQGIKHILLVGIKAPVFSAKLRQVPYAPSPFQTIKCLLIYPNPESALNEEAGKLLLEHYDEYSRHARMMTEIHAKASRSASSRTDVAGPSEDSEIDSKKRAVDKSSATGATASVTDKKKKEKKKALKRL